MSQGLHKGIREIPAQFKEDYVTQAIEKGKDTIGEFLKNPASCMYDIATIDIDDDKNIEYLATRYLGIRDPNFAITFDGAQFGGKSIRGF